MTPIRPRVLVVDDSAFARRVLRTIIQSDPRLEYVGAARDGVEALDQIASLAPDVVTLDLVMPHLDGLGVLRALDPQDAPRFVVVSSSALESEIVVEALASGAVDVVHKPTALATDRLYELREELARKVLVAAAARPRAMGAAGPGVEGTQERARPGARQAWEPGPLVRAVRTELLVVGTSTGGPQALTRLLATLPSDFPLPIAMALHIPQEYTAALARRLDGVSPLQVVEATEGAPLVPGQAVLARGGVHLLIERDGGALRARLRANVTGDPYVPSVDRLFESAAASTRGHLLGVVLTGMGNDGVRGARAVVDSGGQVLTESERSCVVFGMPRSIQEAALSSADAPIDRMAALIAEYLERTEEGHRPRQDSGPPV